MELGCLSRSNVYFFDTQNALMYWVSHLEVSTHRMNKIYRLIWNTVHHSWVPASEVRRRRGKIGGQGSCLTGHNNDSRNSPFLMGLSVTLLSLVSPVMAQPQITRDVYALATMNKGINHPISINGGEIILNDVAVTTGYSYGLHASGVGTVITVNGGSINMLASSVRGEAVLVDEGSKINLSDVNIKTSNANSGSTTGHGALVMGTVNIDNSTIHAYGNNANGVQIDGDAISLIGGTVNANGSSIISDLGVGVLVQGAGSKANFIGGTITGATAGLSLKTGAQSNMTNSSITATSGSAHGVSIDAGGEARLTNGSVTVTGNNAYALYAAGADAYIKADGTDLQTDGLGGSIVYAGASGRIDLKNLDVVGTAGAYGILANNGEITANNVKIDTTGNGVVSRNGGKVFLDGGNLASRGTSLHTSGAGSEIHVKDMTIEGGVGFSTAVSSGGKLFLDSSMLNFTGTPGQQSYGSIWIAGLDSHLEANNVNVSNGFYDVSSGASLSINGGSAIARDGNLRIMGDSASKTVGKVDIDGTHFETTGGYGVNVNIWSSLNVKNAQFIVNDGLDGIWLSGDTSSAVLTDTVIKTYGGDGNNHGVDVWGGSATLNGGAISTYGNNVYGLKGVVSTGNTIPQIIANNVDIHTYGDGGGGLFLGGGNVDTELNGTNIITNGVYSHGIVQINTAKLKVENADIQVKGSDSVAYRSYIAADGPYWNRLTIRSSKLQTEDGAALWLQGDNYELTLKNTEVTGRKGSDADSGTVLRVSDLFFTDGSSIATSQAILKADASRLTGDVLVNSGTAVVDVSLINGSVLTGAINGSDGHYANSLMLDASSVWNVRGDSGISRLSSAGTVAFVAPLADGGFKTLTIKGDYVGNDGILVMNTALSGDDSLTDKLVIEGDTHGNTFVQVKNAGGAGAQTDNGIELIGVAGVSEGMFELQGRAVAGLYDYQLYKGGKSMPDDGGWYLRSEVPTPPIPPISPPEPLIELDIDEPTDPEVFDSPTPVSPITPALRPEPAAYLGNQNAALRMFQHTMYDRVGEPGLTAHDDGRGYAAWVRVQSRNLDVGTVGNQIDINTNATIMQMGMEKQFAVGGGRVHFGVMSGYGNAITDGISKFTTHKSHGEVKGTNLGLYGTWFQNVNGWKGLYVDTWAQYGRFDNMIKGDYLDRERYDSRIWSGSVEVGYAFSVHNGECYVVYVEPQAQAIYTDFSSDDVHESNGTLVQARKTAGTTTRLGARVYSRADGGQSRAQPFAAVNWWSGGNTLTIEMDGERLSRDLPKDTYEAKVGVQLKLGQGWNGWGQVGYQQGSNGYRDVNGQIGVKFNW